MAVPVFLAIVIGVITTLSLPIFTLGPEQFSVYSTSYEESDFKITDIDVKYYTRDELTIYFDLSSQVDVDDLYFEFICRGSAGEFIETGNNETYDLVIDFISGTPNSILSNSEGTGQTGPVMGVFELDLDAGDYTIEAIISLEDIAVDTESFYIELKQN
jgi:hypothetical protein